MKTKVSSSLLVGATDRHHRLRAYCRLASPAFGTAGALVPAVITSPVAADIIHSDDSILVGLSASGFTSFVVEAASGTELFGVNVSYGPAMGAFGRFYATMTVRSDTEHGYRSAARLAAGDVVGASNVEAAATQQGHGPFHSLVASMYSNATFPGEDSTYPVQFGNWRFNGEQSRGFVGFAFTSDEGRRYGWAEIELEYVPGVSVSLAVLQWAFDDTGAAILAGQTGSDPVPGPGGLVVLACGAAGVRKRRRTRAQAQA